MRLIDADKMLKQSCNISAFKQHIGSVYDVNSFIIDQPTVQTEKHGHWVETSGVMLVELGWMRAYYCSECENKYVVTNYCPNCGAKMDEVST